MSKEDFYIGYLPNAPKSISRFVKMVVVIILVVVAGLGFGFTSLQNEFRPATFEFGEYCTYEGIIMEQPYPRLLVKRPGDTGALASYSQYYLATFGKHGAAEAVAGLDAHNVKFDGSLIYADNQTMIELADAPVEDLGAALNRKQLEEARKLPIEELGEFTLKGEIVDSKCYFGVMNPGHLKVHKACAINCILGGVPPVFLTKDKQGNIAYYLLEDEQGNALNKRILDKIAEPLEIKGTVLKQGDLLVIRANPDTYKNL